jgi:hypothetical protein
MEKSMKRIVFIIMALAALCGCQKEVELLHPLTLSSASVMMPAEGGRHVIVVYTKGEWTAELSQPVDWATIETISGKDIGGIGFVCAQNMGVGRSVDVVVRQGEFTDVITMNQSSALSSLTFEFEKSGYMVSSASQKHSFKFNTNIPNLSSCADVVVTDGLGNTPNWINDIYIEGDRLFFTVGGTNRDRIAQFTVTAVDKADGSLSKVAKASFSQTSESPYLVPGDWVTGVEHPAEASVVTVPLQANIGYALVYMMERAVVSEPWAKLVLENSDENNIAIAFEENTSGVSRECTITIPYSDHRGNSFPISFKLVQGA